MLYHILFIRDLWQFIIHIMWSFKKKQILFIAFETFGTYQWFGIFYERETVFYHKRWTFNHRHIRILKEKKMMYEVYNILVVFCFC